MYYGYEVIEHTHGLPLKMIINHAYEVPYHWHNDMEILIVLKGEVLIQIEGQENRLKEDDLIIINNNYLHNTVVANSSSLPIIAGIQIDTTYFDAYIQNFSKKRFLCKSFLHGKYYQNTINPIRGALAKLFLEYSTYGKDAMVAIWGITSLLCHFINNNIEFEMDIHHDKSCSENDFERLSKIMEYISTHYKEKITLDEVAELVHVNKYYLSHLFKKNTGIGFKSYINHIRLDQVMRSILSNKISISDIANDCGFSNLNSFYKLFREKYHCSPAEMREQYRDLKKQNYKETILQDYLHEKFLSYLEKDNSSLNHLTDTNYQNKKYPIEPLVHR